MSVQPLEAQDAAEVSCVILPLRNVQLVVPAACVAEVLPWRNPAPLQGAPGWCLGSLQWHGTPIAVVDHEAIGATIAPEEQSPWRCIAVIKRTTPDARWPFFALVVRGIPRLVQVAQIDLSAERDTEVDGELLRVRVGAELLVIPDLAMLDGCLACLSLGAV